MSRLTRAQQDDILLPVVFAYRRVHRQRNDLCVPPYHPDPDVTLCEFREDLRLDDPVLDALIAAKKKSGQPWGPWQTPTYKKRAA